jgi:hypothetical protein
MNPRWCLVTGGAGFVGSRVIRALNDMGWDRIRLRLDADPIRTVPMPDGLRDRFQSYTKAEGVLPWVSELTARRLEKMVAYWTKRAWRQ